VSSCISVTPLSRFIPGSLDEQRKEVLESHLFLGETRCHR
jgi:hypothetical protein